MHAYSVRNKGGVNVNCCVNCNTGVIIRRTCTANKNVSNFTDFSGLYARNDNKISYFIPNRAVCFEQVQNFFFQRFFNVLITLISPGRGKGRMWQRIKRMVQNKAEWSWGKKCECWCVSVCGRWVGSVEWKLSEMARARKVVERQICSKLMSVPRGTLVIYFLSLFR